MIARLLSSDLPVVRWVALLLVVALVAGVLASLVAAILA